MTHPMQSLQKELDETIRLVDHGSLLSLTPEEKASVRDNARELVRKLAFIQGSFLTVGLLGGTGVGKSTLMNALAGSDIASTSHRRPHTDDILVYRHVEADPLPALPLADIPWREITHPENAIRQILLCDLPDFDSIVGEHRDRVLAFMEHLDVLVWVTSPEKYADGRFFEFLQHVPKSRANFYFVLNKVDLLFDGHTLEAGYQKMALVAGRFQEHIRKTGIDSPLFYTLSSEQALTAGALPPWNHFPAFRQQIFQQRDIKQIKAIKAANLDVEVQRLLGRFEREVVNLRSFERILQDAAKALEEKRPQWAQAGNDIIDLYLDRHIRQEVLDRQDHPSCLIGPGRTLATVVEGWKNRFSGRKVMPPDSVAPPLLGESTVAGFKRRYEWLEDRLRHHILRDNLPPAYQEWVQDKLDPARGVEDLTEQFSHIVSVCLQGRPSLSCRRFQAVQFCTYFVLLILFLFAVGGEAAWQAVVDHPGGRAILRLVVSGVHTLFSTKGLAAIGSYILINLLFAQRFYRRYRNIREKAAEKIIGFTKIEMRGAWEQALVGILDQVNQMGQEVQVRISSISKLRDV